MQNAFEWWIGQQVVVQLAFGQIKVSLRGMLLRDQTDTLLMRPEVGSDIEIAKTRVLAIEEMGRSSRSLPRRNFGMARRVVFPWLPTPDRYVVASLCFHNLTCCRPKPSFLDKFQHSPVCFNSFNKRLVRISW